MREAGQEKGRWANQSAETWHDNFGYEQEQRQEWALSDRLDVGCTVTIRDVETDQRRTVVVGSYQVLDQQHENEVSYAAPLARPLRGATVGEEREVTIGDRSTLFRVVEIA